MDSRAELIDLSIALLGEIRNLTPGDALEARMNDQYGPGTETFDALARLSKEGVENGWAAQEEVTGPHYRRGRLVDPCAETFYFSITVVYMESGDGRDGVFRGDYHAHPYGEINLITSVTPGAAIAGPNGWCSNGWTSPAPGTHHYPEVKGGGGNLIVLFARWADLV